MGSLSDLLITIPAVLIALTFHEMSHGFAAYLLGDNTAKDMGRLTLNPISHIDPAGLLCMIIFKFGWAKPVPVNPNNFKNPKLGMALTAFAGPLSNFLLALVSMVIYVIMAVTAKSAIMTSVADFFQLLAIVNAGLGVFNLIPVPPLDGSKVMFLFLPDSLVDRFYQYEGYIRLALMMLLYMGFMNGVVARGQMAILNACFDAALGLCRLVGVL